MQAGFARFDARDAEACQREAWAAGEAITIRWPDCDGCSSERRRSASYQQQLTHGLQIPALGGAANDRPLPNICCLLLPRFRNFRLFKSPGPC